MSKLEPIYLLPQEYMSFCNKEQGSWNIKRLPLIKENQTSQIKEFRAFLSIGRCKSLGSLKSFLWYTPLLSGGQYPHFFKLSAPAVGDCSSWLLYGRHPVSILNSLRAHLQSSCNVMAWWLQHPLLLSWKATFFSLIKSILLFVLNTNDLFIYLAVLCLRCGT